MSLRFGITALEFSPLAQDLIQGGLANLTNFDTIKHIKRMLEIEHISVLELSFDVIHIIPGAFSEKVIDRLIKMKEELGISYTVHLPLWSIELTTFNEPVRRGGVESTVNAIKVAEPLEPESYVLHATGSLAAEFSKLTFPPNIVEMICTLMSSFSAKSVEEILAQSEMDPRRLAIENLEFPFDITRSVVDEYDTGICFDTGHLMAQMCGTESVIEFYEKHKDRIVELHLHDGSPKRTSVGSGYIDHRPLGTQELPVREFLLRLLEDKFKYPIIFELTSEEARQSLKYIGQIVPEALNG